MAAYLQCEFMLVRYVPDPVRNEFVNIGVLLRAAGRPETTLVRFTRDWGRVRCVDPDADTTMLELLEGEIRQELGETNEDLRPVTATLEDSLSNGIQLTVAKGCLAENMVVEMDQLMRLYVEPKKRESVARRSGRPALLGAMRSQFERAGVWDLMRKRIAASEYTQKGDPLKIDCGYRNGKKVKMFHAVSLLGDFELAKVLAFSAEALQAGVWNAEKRELELAAIVEPLRRDGVVQGDEDQVAQYGFAKGVLENANIRVLTTSFLPGVAEQARRDLQV